MDTDFRGDRDHHDGTSDATPGGYPQKRRPGELGFAAFLSGASLFLLYSAYGISGFESLSAPGAVPMATTLVMAVTVLLITLRTAQQQRVTSETLAKDILPGTVVMFIGFLTVFGVLLQPLGFVLTAALFLLVSIKVLARKSWVYTIGVTIASLAIIWLIFRVVFTVLLPAGILPEAEFIQLFRNLVSGAA